MEEKINLLTEHPVYEIARDFHGVDFELSMLQEECAELIVAISKLKRGVDNKALMNMAEEIADVENLLQQVRFWFPEIVTEINLMRVSKLDRLKKRIEDAQKDVMARIDGKCFHCAECGCNVFRHPMDEPQVFVCNSCGALYKGE